MDTDTPSVLTSEVYNDAEVIFNMLQNKEKLVSFLDCITLLRGMGMNPAHDDMDKLKSLMAQPILRLEQWRREEELKREKERRKEEARERKGKGRMSVTATKKTAAEKAADANAEAAAAVDITPAEEIKNIDWNIFISCAQMIFRDRMREERAVLESLKVFVGDAAGVMTRDRLMEIVTTNGDNVLTPAEMKILVPMLPESCCAKEWAGRLEGTYVPPTQAEIDAAAMREIEARRQQEAAEKLRDTENDLLEGL